MTTTKIGHASSAPDWLLETPNETTYTLTMFGDGGDGIQEIELTRAEFIALKRALAKLREIPVPVENELE